MNEIIDLEKKICLEIGINYYEIELKKLNEIVSKELNLADTSLNKIFSYFQENEKRIVKYISCYITTKNIKIIGSGFIISHSIFINLFEKSPEYLIKYLEKYNTKKQSEDIFRTITDCWNI